MKVRKGLLLLLLLLTAIGMQPAERTDAHPSVCPTDYVCPVNDQNEQCGNGACYCGLEYRPGGYRCVRPPR